MTTTVYDPWQTTFFFNVQANDIAKTSVAVSLDKTLSKADALKAAASAAAQSLTKSFSELVAKEIEENNTSETPILGAKDWTLVWGPQVLCIKPVLGSVHWWPLYKAKFNAANAMFVVYSQNLNRYVVAIAATNATSLYDWFVEDFDTSHVVSWGGAMQVWNGGTNSTAAAAGIPCISQATYIGISNLLNIVDTQITQKTLVGFLKGLSPEAGATLTFTGHSLAGALSPTLAMACFDEENGLLKGGSWTVGAAMVYPTAGATPGNQPFADLFNAAGWGGSSETGTHPWQRWNVDLYNNVDVVPHAWGADMMDQIPGLYHVAYDDMTTAVIQGAIDNGRATAKKGEAIAGPYTPISNQALNQTGTAGAAQEFVYLYTLADGEQEYLTPAEVSQITPAPTGKTALSWVEQVLFQHTTAYGRLIMEMPAEPRKKQ